MKNNLIDFPSDSEPQLNIQNFKSVFLDFNWIKKVRKLGSNEQIFYFCKEETKEKIIEISIRPSKRMQIHESFKRRDGQGRAIPEGTRPREVVNFGSTVEVLVDDSLINKIDSIAKAPENKKQTIVSWD